MSREGSRTSRRAPAWLPRLALLSSLVCLWAADAAAVTTSYREGAGGYVGTQDTELQEVLSDSSFGAADIIRVDDGEAATGIQQALIRFDGIFGAGAGQIPLGATITAVTLTLQVTDAQAPGNANITIHRMLAAWSEASTWNSMGNGIQRDDVEARIAADDTIADPTSTGPHSFSGPGMVASVQAWSDGAANRGWVIRSDVVPTWEFQSSENAAAATRPQLSIAYSFQIAGRVFEDFNYGGGVGRSFGVSGGSGRSGARVEVFDAGGAFLTSTSTDASGAYALTGLDPGSYTVRVVNGTVSSSRVGWVAGLVPVQTYRTDASTGTAAAVVDHVGGEVPGKVDAGNGSTTLAALTTATTTAQSIAPAAISSTHVTGIDFGYCFDVIVTTRDAGQGSLRQFLTNADALANAGLAQAGRTAGTENAIWMLSDGTARAGMHAGYASQFTAGVATIAPLSALPAITDPVVLDATTQPGWSSTPIVELDGAAAGAGAEGLTITISTCTIRGLAIGRFGGTGILLDGASTTGSVIVANRIGTDPGGTLDRGNGEDGVRIINGANGNTVGGTLASNANLIAFNDGNGVTVAADGGTGNQIGLNAIHSNGALGIDLGGDGVTANDGAKTAGQPNRRMDHPVFTGAVLAGSTLTVVGYVGSAPGQAAFANSRVEIFEADNDASGFGEGLVYHGFVTSSVANGNFSGSVTVAGIAAGDEIAGTATDGTGNTSEFGAQHAVEIVALVKRAHLADGTPITNMATVPKGTLVKFLLYLNNQGPLITDVSVQDALAAGFQYVAGSARFTNTVAACALPACTAAEEAAIFAAANAGTAATDAVDADAVSFAGSTLDMGNQSVANARLDLAAGRVWALVFSVRTQ